MSVTTPTLKCTTTARHDYRSELHTSCKLVRPTFRWMSAARPDLLARNALMLTLTLKRSRWCVTNKQAEPSRRQTTTNRSMCTTVVSQMNNVGVVCDSHVTGVDDKPAAADWSCSDCRSLAVFFSNAEVTTLSYSSYDTAPY